MKKRIIGLMVICLVVALTGCGKESAENNNETGNEITNITAVASNSKVIKLMSGDYYAKYNSEIEGEKGEIEITQKADKMAMKIKTEEGSMRVVVDKEISYLIMDESKMYMKSATSEENQTDDFNFASDLDETEMKSGKETVDGVEYYYEEFDGTKFYFIKDDLKMITTEDGKIIVEESVNKAKDELFNIPADYQELSF